MVQNRGYKRPKLKDENKNLFACTQPLITFITIDTLSDKNVCRKNNNRNKYSWKQYRPWEYPQSHLCEMKTSVDIIFPLKTEQTPRTLSERLYNFAYIAIDHVSHYWM